MREPDTSVGSVREANTNVGSADKNVGSVRESNINVWNAMEVNTNICGDHEGGEYKNA